MGLAGGVHAAALEDFREGQDHAAATAGGLRHGEDTSAFHQGGGIARRHFRHGRAKGPWREELAGVLVGGDFHMNHPKEILRLRVEPIDKMGEGALTGGGGFRGMPEALYLLHVPGFYGLGVVSEQGCLDHGAERQFEESAVGFKWAQPFAALNLGQGFQEIFLMLVEHGAGARLTPPPPFLAGAVSGLTSPLPGTASNRGTTPV